MRRTSIVMAGLLVAGVSMAGCGGSTVTQGPGLPSPSASPAASDPSASAMTVTRSGGIAGFHDTVEIAPDGSAQVSSRTGETSACTPDPAALGRLRAIDLAAVGSGPPKQPIADGFTYTLDSAAGHATAGDGDNVGVRAEFVAAAAAVVSSCLATRDSGSFPTE